MPIRNALTKMTDVVLTYEWFLCRADAHERSMEASAVWR